LTAKSASLGGRGRASLANSLQEEKKGRKNRGKGKRKTLFFRHKKPLLSPKREREKGEKAKCPCDARNEDRGFPRGFSEERKRGGTGLLHTEKGLLTLLVGKGERAIRKQFSEERGGISQPKEGQPKRASE